MFRNPRENALRSDNEPRLGPQLGRPPSPPSNASPNSMATSMSTTTPAKPAPLKNGFTARSRPSPTSNNKPKQKAQQNGSILSFFKKADPLADSDRPLFIQEHSTSDSSKIHNSVANSYDDWTEEDARYHENGGSVKRFKTGHTDDETEARISFQHDDSVDDLFDNADKDGEAQLDSGASRAENDEARKLTYVGPFLEESDSEDDKDQENNDNNPGHIKSKAEEEKPCMVESSEDVNPSREPGLFVDETVEKPKDSIRPSGETSIVRKEESQSNGDSKVPSLKHETTSFPGEDAFEGLGDMDDFEDEYELGDEYMERRYMREQRQLEMNTEGFDNDLDNDEDDLKVVKEEAIEECSALPNATEISTLSEVSCPICSVNLTKISDHSAALHVNACLDGNPIPLPQEKIEESKPKVQSSAQFRRPPRPAKPGQENPFQLGSVKHTSAFSKLMAGHSEDEAWAIAAAAENAARGKPAFIRTCPFYKILPGFHICVDAFRYGAVEGCKAYFLSHFHSDHYIGLTKTWTHGPIYCSRPTANLIKQQLRTDARFVVEIEYEQKLEVPGTKGVFVTMIPANHCPGSSLYLFEKTIGSGQNAKVQRVLHCGDFRACPAHIEHPLLKPDVLDIVSGKTLQQKIDVCYLDTTYLNPKYAFPSQEDVIKACADMCVSMNKVKIDESDGWEQTKKERAGGSMTKFVQKSTTEDNAAGDDTKRGRLLVIVGTYSIGKERICLGIARALKSLIYAPPGKQRICACLEDPELSAHLTDDPRAAQVHMTPLFEIRAETLADYLADFRDRFDRAVGFRPSGWNYRPPGGRFTESPSVNTVLYSDNWRSTYSMRDLVPQRGSSSKAACFGVPYSEHSSFRELTMFCCALRIEKIIPTVNVGSAKSREKMKLWCERWAVERKKGLFVCANGKNGEKNDWYPGMGTWELKRTL